MITDYNRYRRIRVTLDDHTFHMDFEQPMEYSKIDAFLERTFKDHVVWHPEKQFYPRHYPVYLNRLDTDSFQIYGQINGIAAKEHTGPHQGMFCTDIQFLDYHKRLVKQKLLPTANPAGLYDTLVRIYEDEIKNPSCDIPIRYHLYVCVDGDRKIGYIRETLMDTHPDAPKFKDRICDPSDLGREINAGWGPSVRVPQDEGIYQMVVEARWSPVQARTLRILSCTPVCLF